MSLTRATSPFELSHSSTSDNFNGAFEVLDEVLSRCMRTKIGNLHARFLLQEPERHAAIAR